MMEKTSVIKMRAHPLFSSSEVHRDRISLKASPWDTPYIPPEKTIHEIQAESARLLYGTEKRPCGYPGCANTIGHANSSGVCKHHNHARIYCQCKDCRKRRDDQ